ncbi:MAG: nitroreductase family protein [Candidatus Hodarchaeota archaeon]
MDVTEAIKKRRSYRSLDSVEISDEMLIDFAKVVQMAPSCMNKQPWNLIFVRDKNKLKELFMTLTPGNKWVEKASLIIAIFSKKEDDCLIKDRLYYLFDNGLAVSLLILRATELGLIAHPIAGFNEDQAKGVLNIPDDNLLITLIIIGRHSTEINPVLSESMKLGEKQRPPRKPLDQFVFLNEFGSKLKE